MKFGCHISIRGGYLNAAKHAVAIKAAAYQFFPKNPRSLTIKKFDKENAALCKEFSRKNGLVSVAHTPYPTSLTPLADKKELTIKSLVNDLEIADACGASGVVAHFGSHISADDPLAGYQLMIEMLNSVLVNWEGDCKILLENNAGKPGSIGTTLEELVQVRNLCDYPDKVGFCLDTCHAFASGLWRGDNTEELLAKGNETGYFKELVAIHFNNSKYPAESGKDRHANIFKNGHITERQFAALIGLDALKNVPFILETPSDEGVTHKEEVRLLNEKWG
ncbi:deoxyribonuclease IV [Bacillus sp. T33-2]|uniref:deoxyribonuclease IV n=1 Tax=Bacillus sp. T33-2 TaxID=2054168 RepID=UPI000C77480F|nr:deoxyribonuclease IV [Bacillus sp. T33-2]PLR91132.1 endonuclease IV [Bacillus sp. T33-2]